MSARVGTTRFAARPSGPDAWAKAAKPASPASGQLTARLTVDITPELRGRIKVTAFQRGLTVADMLRALLAREYGDDESTAS